MKVEYVIAIAVLVGLFSAFLGWVVGWLCGYRSALKDTNVLTGKDAKEFLKKTGLDKIGL